MSKIWSLPETLIVLAGSCVGKLARLKELGALARPWRAEIQALEQRLSSRAMASDAAVEELRGQVKETAEALRSRLWARDFGELEAKVLGRREVATLSHLEAYDRRLKELERASPWATAVADLETRLATRMESLASIASAHQAAHAERLAVLERQMQDRASPFARNDDVSARFATHTARIRALEQRVDDHERKLDSAAAIVAALEKAVSPRLSELEQRLELQARSLEQLGAAAMEAEAALQRALDSVESLSRSAAAQPEPVPAARAAGAPLINLIDEDAELAKILHIRL